MALSGPTLLGTPLASTGNNASYATASASPTAGALIVVGVWNSDASNAIRPTLSSAFSVVGGTWTDHGSAQNSTAVTRITLFSAVADGAPGSGAITADFGGDSQTGCIILAVEYTGQDGSAPLIQPTITGHTGAGVTSRTMTLGSVLGAATNQMLSFIGHNVNEVQAAAGGATELASSDVGYNTPTNRMAVYHETNDNSHSATWSTAAVANGASCEIVEAVAGITNEETGAGPADTIASGTDVAEHVEVGAGPADTVLAGADVAEHAETGATPADTVAAGADVYEAVESGATPAGSVASGIAEKAGAGTTYEKAGAGVADTTAAADGAFESIESGAATADTVTAAADVSEYVETGAGLADTLLAGVSQYVPPGPVTHEKAGSGVASSAGAAADAFEAVETGSTYAGTLYVGSDVYEAVETGAAFATALLAGFSEGAAVIVTYRFDDPSPAGGAPPGSPAGTHFDPPTPLRVLA